MFSRSAARLLLAVATLLCCVGAVRAKESSAAPAVAEKPEVVVDGTVTLRSDANAAIDGASDAEQSVYQASVRGDFSIEFRKLVPGRYRLVAGNAELEFRKPKERVFSILANGTAVAPAVDLVAQSGFAKRADTEFEAEPANGVIRVSFVSGKGRGRAHLSFLRLLDPQGAVLAEYVAARQAPDKSASAPVSPDPERVRQIAALLSEKPAGVGAPISDRATWATIAADAATASSVLTAAVRMAGEEPPALTDELYLLYSTKGSRSEYEKPYEQRTSRLAAFVVAEGIENKGRFVAPAERELRAIVAEKTWTLPAHDPSLAAFQGKRQEVDLGVAMRAWTVATADAILGERLSPEARRELRDALEARVFAPYRAAARKGDTTGVGWIRRTNNWNAVCHAGVVGSALAVLEPKEERALFIAGAERNLEQFYLEGFSNDGYCSEGVGYWNYGFGHFLLLAEAVFAATGGKDDWYSHAKVPAIARFPQRLEILPGVWPAFADSPLNPKPAGWVEFLASLHLKENGGSKPDLTTEQHPLGAMLYQFGIVSTRMSNLPAATNRPARTMSLRDQFADAGVFIARPAASSASGMGVALKGGHNDEHHNHNDLGTFVVAIDKSLLLVDPGMEIYTARTFGPKRYDSKVINSFGHPVPVVAGKLQETGANSRAVVLDSSFTDAEDRLSLDLQSAYAVPTLQELTREWVYSRQDRGSLAVHDKVRFETPETFGTALITFAKWRQADPATLFVYDSSSAVRVQIESTAGTPVIKTETLDEKLPGGGKALRIGINLPAPVTEAGIILRIAPVPLAEASGKQAEKVVSDGRAPDRAGEIRIQAEEFSAEAGGKVEKVDKTAAVGTALRMWNDKGHSLSWKVTVPEDGEYAVGVRYCHAGTQDATRSIAIDGKEIAGEPFAFPSTGGWSSTADDWSESWLSRGGREARFTLSKGEHILTLTAAGDSPLNVDSLYLAPIRAGKGK